MDSENLSSLIRLSVSDGQKTDSSKDVSFIAFKKSIILRRPVASNFAVSRFLI